MRAEILAIGSELLDPSRQETNAAHITGRLLEVGIEVGTRVTVADDLDLVASAFRQALQRAEVVIATGGLGPTEDDLTREALAAALGRPLFRDERILDELRQRFARYARVMAEVNVKQADVVEGAVVLDNPRGSAPGQRIESEGRVVFLLPGPPTEMAPMLEAHVLPELRTRARGNVIQRRVLRIAAMAESDVEQAVAPLYRAFTNPRTTILGAVGQVELHLVAQAESIAAAQQKIEELAAGMREALPGRIFSEDGRELHEVVAGLLREQGLSLAVAESCTGGMLAAQLTRVPGSSTFFERGYVTYSNRSKTELLGVEPGLLERHGAVSEEAAGAMAEGARRAAGTDLAVAITGIAGPDGGTPDKPVGLVYVAMAGTAGQRVRRIHFPGDRERVRRHSCVVALEMLRRALLRLQDT